MTLLFLRHGESEGNAQGLIQGWLDYPLTTAGETQAATAARYLESVGATALYSSPLRRARQTADAVAATTGLEVVELPELSEYHFGEAQGLRWSEAAARWGLRDSDWGVGRVPGEEGMEAFRERVSRRFEELAGQHADEDVICVAHGGVIGAIVAHIVGLGPHEHAPIYTANCSLTIFEGPPATGVSKQQVIRTLNELCHLRELAG